MRVYAKKIWAYKMMYLLIMPGLAFYVIFRYLPMYGAIIAFKDFQVLDGIMGSPWADPWYKHFQSFFDSPYFSQVLVNTIFISVLKIIWGVIPGVTLAVLLHETRNAVFRKWVQTLSYMPHFLSWVIIYGILLAFFSETNGLVNKWLKELVGASYPFMTSTDSFRGILIGSDIWQNMGWSAIVYLAAIAGIDPTLYEAARVDGASRLRMIWHITLPGIRSVIILMLILKIGYILDAGFDQIYILYNVHVYPVADIIDTWVFRMGLEQFNFSVAAAVGLLKSAVGLVLVLGANRIAKMWGENLW
ncbi:MAG: binding-protein-dependent transport system inner rane component [Paenibacillaceae bacterium]|jgi:putative aldouronate transport system permease protein|nr:binding-protein-dependent transport system inner rane component [Paenibacillaceae bacterium]